jgi:hypothetical protein
MGRPFRGPAPLFAPVGFPVTLTIGAMRLPVALMVLVAVALIAAGCGGKKQRATASISAGTSQCDEMGITTSPAREGVCEVKGFTISVANKAHWLHVGEYDVRLVGLRTATALHTGAGRPLRANGKFVIGTLTVKNKLDVPRAFNERSTLVSLRVDKKNFTEDRDAEGSSIDSFRLHGRVMQPDETDTGTIVFDLPAEHAKNLYARGSDLVFINFSGESSGYPASGNAPQRLGYLRLWK